MAETLNDLEVRLGLPQLAQRLGEALQRSADPSAAPQRAADVLEAAAAADIATLRSVWCAAPDTVVRILAAVAGAAPFLIPYLMRHADWLGRLASDEWVRRRTTGEFHQRLTQWLRQGCEDEGTMLRRFKYYELARITVRDLSVDLVPLAHAGDVLAELSHLADALLERALAVAAMRVQRRFGPPQWTDVGGRRVRLGCCALGLGKLGSEELNYSSDVDLIYVFESPPGGDASALRGGPGLSPPEYFTRVAQELGRLVSEATREGFLYRVDLDLRPEGSQGPLVVSTDMLANYYEIWAATWEKAAFMKARPVAGDAALGWRTVRGIAPMIYRSAMDFAAVAAIRQLKERVEQTAERTAAAFNVKIGSGGIRDVEFVAQALQLLHGGRMPQVRGRSTQAALIALAQVGVLPPPESEDLLASYRFLRRTENRLQMEAERQIHRLPAERAGLERLGRSMGFSSGNAAEEFVAAVDAHRQRIRRIFSALLHDGGSERVLALFLRSAPRLLANPMVRGQIEELATQFARAIDASPDAERAMNNLDRFIRALGARRFYYELLLDRPELVPRLAALFAASEYFSSYFATHPRLIEPIFSDPNVLLLSRAELWQDCEQIRRDLEAEGGRDDAELALDTLRLFHHRQLLNVGLLDLAGKIRLEAAEEALSEIAEVALEQALLTAHTEMQRRAPVPAALPRGQFLVVGMGKLASRELTYGSDLDVIFLYDVASTGDDALLEAQEYFVRLAQKLIWALRTRTSEGVGYEIDARLRPSGNQGMLVTSCGAFARYHADSAQVWERQALLRARPVAGDRFLGEVFEMMRREILRRPLPPGTRAEIDRIRGRVESELARETHRRHDFKTGRGGLHDIETVVQYLQLVHGAAHDDLFDVTRTTVQLTRLEQYGFLGAEDARALRGGWQFLQLLSSRLRIMDNRSISDLDEERGDLDALAQRLGYSSPQRAGGARRALLEDYRRHTAAIREIYHRVLRT